MDKRFMLAITIICFVTVSKSQSILAEFKLPPGKIGSIQSFVHGDTILLSVDTSDPKFGVDIKRFFLVNSDKDVRSFSSTLIGNAQLCGISKFDDKFYLYHLIGKRKNLMLKGLTYSMSTGEQILINTEIELDGALVGTWNDRDLFLLVYNNLSNQLKILQVHKMEILSEKVFDLPFDFSKDYKGFTFIPESKFTSIDQGASKFKIYKINNQLILTVDLTLAELETKSQTTVVRINMETGEQTTKRLVDNSLTYFRSFISDDKLYKTAVSKKYFFLRVYDLVTDSLVGMKDIVRDTTFKEIFVYKRVGADFRISRKESLFTMMKISESCLPSVVVVKEDSCSYSLVWATYFNDKGGIGTPAGFGTSPLVGLLTLAFTTAIKQIGEPPGISRYFYLESDANDANNFVQSTIPSLRQIIDDYEHSLDLKRVYYDYKGYFDYKDGGIGVYRGHRDEHDKLKLVWFKKPSVDSN